MLNTPERIRPVRPEVLAQQAAAAKQESFKLREQLQAAKQTIKLLSEQQKNGSGIGSDAAADAGRCSLCVVR